MTAWETLRCKCYMDREHWLPWIDSAACSGCGDCIAICPTGTLGWRGKKAVVVNPDACAYDAACETACPVKAIALPYQVILEADLSDRHSTECHNGLKTEGHNAV